MLESSNEKKIKVTYRTWGDRGYQEEREVKNIPVPGDEVVFEDKELFLVVSRTFSTQVTGEVICDIWLGKPEVAYA